MYEHPAFNVRADEASEDLVETYIFVYTISNASETVECSFPFVVFFWSSAFLLPFEVLRSRAYFLFFSSGLDWTGVQVDGRNSWWIALVNTLLYILHQCSSPKFILFSPWARFRLSYTTSLFLQGVPIFPSFCVWFFFKSFEYLSSFPITTKGSGRILPSNAVVEQAIREVPSCPPL